MWWGQVRVAGRHRWLGAGGLRGGEGGEPVESSSMSCGSSSGRVRASWWPSGVRNLAVVAVSMVSAQPCSGGVVVAVSRPSSPSSCSGSSGWGAFGWRISSLGRRPGRPRAPGRPDAAPVPARHRLAPPRRRRRDRPQLSCQSSCQRRSPRARTGGYVGWGVQESNLPKPVAPHAVEDRFMPLTCENTTVSSRLVLVCRPRYRTVRCHYVATPDRASRQPNWRTGWQIACAGRCHHDCASGTASEVVPGSVELEVGVLHRKPA